MAQEQVTDKPNSRDQYSIFFKRYIVRKVEKGEISKEAARRQYKIGGHSTILKWCRKYGTLHSRLVNKTDTNMASTTDKQSTDARIKELELALEEEKLKSLAYKTMIDIAEETFGIEIRKKLGAKQLKESAIHPGKSH